MKTQSIRMDLRQARALLIAATVTMEGFTSAIKDGVVPEKDKHRMIGDMVALMTVSLTLKGVVDDLKREEKLDAVRAAQEAADANG